MARQSHIKFSIPEPCNVPWDGMSPVDSERRHCSSCDKVITDFSKMSDDELMLYFKHSKGNVCGLFGKHQLDRRIKLLPEETRKAGWWRMLLLIPLSLFSKSAKAQYYESMTANEQTQLDKTSQDSLITNQQREKVKADSAVIAVTPIDTAATDSTISQVAKKDSLNPKDSLVVTEFEPSPNIIENVLMGDVYTTLGYCVREPQPISPGLVMGNVTNPIITPDSNKEGDQLSEYDPIKDLTDQQEEKPKPEQPALPASNDISAILPKEDRKYKRS